MYLPAIASMWPFTSRANAFSWSRRCASSSAPASNSKLSRGNFESTGTSRSTRITASTRSPVENVYWRVYASGGSRSRSRFSSSSSPKPPRAFGGRRACSRRARSFARASIWDAVPSSLPSFSAICVAVSPLDCCVASSRLSRSLSRRSTVAANPCNRRSTSSLRAASSARIARAKRSSPPRKAQPSRLTTRVTTSRKTLATVSDGGPARGRTEKNQPRRVRRPTGAECRIRLVRRPTGSDAGTLRRAPGSVNVRARRKSARCGLFRRRARRPGGTSVRSPILAAMHDAFVPGGALSLALREFEPRREQAALAAAVARALATGEHLVAEAGTGTGKSLAYLIPALESGERVVVATATKALQEQLLLCEVPAAARALGRDVRVAVLKGRQNYVCRKQLQSFGAMLLRGPRDEQAFEAMQPWLAATTTGDRAELALEPSGALWAELSVGADRCAGGRCPFVSTCFAEAARARAPEAELVIANHALYFADLAAAGAVLPAHGAVVFDEAHRLEESAAAWLGGRISREIGRASCRERV